MTALDELEKLAKDRLQSGNTLSGRPHRISFHPTTILGIIADYRAMKTALSEIFREDYKFHQEAGIVNGPFAKIAQSALERLRVKE